jgi:hypothetical protein
MSGFVAKFMVFLGIAFNQSFKAVRPWFDDKLDNAPTSLVFDYCFIWRKIIKEMLVIRRKKHHKKIPFVEFVAKL